jgi:hypothetical protein
MNTPRQSNVRPGIAAISGRGRNTDPESRPPSPFVVPFVASAPPLPNATAGNPKATNWRSS